MANNMSDPEYPDKKGDREDGKNLTQAWLNKHQKSIYVWNKEQFDRIDPEKVDKVLGKWLIFKLHNEEINRGTPNIIFFIYFIFIYNSR